MTAHKTEDGKRWREWLDLGSDPATGARLRKKVEATPEQPSFLKTESGVGYRFAE